MRITLIVALAALVTACAESPRYSYRPTPETRRQDAPGDVAGAEAAGYRVPKIVPRGDVQLAALGVTRKRQLHVRMVVRNDDTGPWIVEAADQRAAIDGASGLRPAEARCDGDAMPQAVLMPGDTRTIDLFYELPPRLAANAAVPTVRVDWRIETPSGALASDTTAFERHTLPPPPVAPPDPKRLAHDLADSRRDWGSGCPQSVASSRPGVCGATF